MNEKSSYSLQSKISNRRNWQHLQPVFLELMYSSESVVFSGLHIGNGVFRIHGGLFNE